MVLLIFWRPGGKHFLSALPSAVPLKAGHPIGELVMRFRLGPGHSFRGGGSAVLLVLSLPSRVVPLFSELHLAPLVGL